MSDPPPPSPNAAEEAIFGRRRGRSSWVLALSVQVVTVAGLLGLAKLRGPAYARKLTETMVEFTAPPPRPHEQPPPPPPPPPAPLPSPGSCLAVCRADLSPEETRQLNEQVQPYLVEVRQCLVKSGFEPIFPSLILRFDEAGRLLSRLLDTAGADATCVKELAKRPVSFSVKAATNARCELTCR